jgi:hypothetical protein
MRRPAPHRAFPCEPGGDGSVRYLIPDPAPKGGSSAVEGVAADRDGIIYGAEVGPRRVMRYVWKK